MVAHTREPLAARAPRGLRSTSPRAATIAGRLNAPRPALVEAALDGTPRTVNRRAVGFVRDEWRVVDRWWTDEPISRRYFDLVLETGENEIAFRDEELGTWFLQRA
jgi:hypothetical protein